MKERSLVAFTLLSQSAAGTYCVLAGSQLALGATGAPGAVILNPVTLGCVLALALLALLTSFLHLGSPQNAYRALRNLRSSWLSREILVAFLFAACVAAQAGYAVLRGRGTLHPAILFLTCAVAVALVFCISWVYMLRTMPAWHSWGTLVSFLSASLLLGSLTALLLLAAQGARGAAAGVLVSLIGLCAALEIALVFRRAGAERREPRFGEIHAPPQAPPRLRFPVAALLVAGFVLAVLALRSGVPAQMLWLVSALVVLVTAEAINRFGFYTAGLGNRG